jgi:AcrR family transcriptional regulator
MRGDSMPRALTEQEKCRQCKKLIEKGMPIVLSQGIRKVSIEDITKAAGMSKGLFYHHFDSKEKFMIEVIMSLHRQIFALAEQMLSSGGNLQENARGFLLNLFDMPEMAFFTKYYDEINELVESLAEYELQFAEEAEVNMYDKLLIAFGIDTRKVHPGVVHNLMHTMYMIMQSDLMIKDHLQKTKEILMESLLSYIFGGVTK